jgi:hypothetical protein
VVEVDICPLALAADLMTMMPSAKAAEALYRLMIGVEELKFPKYCI